MCRCQPSFGHQSVSPSVRHSACDITSFTFVEGGGDKECGVIGVSHKPLVDHQSIRQSVSLSACHSFTSEGGRVGGASHQPSRHQTSRYKNNVIHLVDVEGGGVGGREGDHAHDGGAHHPQLRDALKAVQERLGGLMTSYRSDHVMLR